MRTSVSLYHRHRFPAEIISHCVWLYFRFALSFRDIEEMLAMRGVALTYETVREWSSSSVRLMLTTCDADLRGLATGGTLMKCSLKLTDVFITYGVRLIRTEMFWTSWSKAKEIRKLLRSSVAVGTPVGPAPPAQIRTCSITAYGSYLGCLASKRKLGCGCWMCALGIHLATSCQNRSKVIWPR